MTAPVSAQELSAEVFPSEDELLQALENGEISFAEFIRLQELATVGLDSTGRYLTDEIPNLAFVPGGGPRSPLEREQVQAFLRVPRPDRGLVRWRFSQRLERPQVAASRYRVSGDIHLSDRWSARWRVHREYTGRERWVHRQVTYRSRSGALRRLMLGNYTARLGLGTLIGYRGKLLDFARTLGGESLLFPDYGGFNGAHATLVRRRLRADMVLSMNRDDRHELTVLGGMLSRHMQGLTVGLLGAVNRLRNRSSGLSVTSAQTALYTWYRHRSGGVAVELTAPVSGGDGAAVLEGTHRTGDAVFEFAAWMYGDRFRDLAAGSKATPISRSVRLQTVDFSYRSRRAGQEGVFVRTRLRPASALSLVNSFLYGGFDRDDYRLQVSNELVYRLRSGHRVSLLYLGRFRDQPAGSGQSRERRHQLRLESRLEFQQLRARLYIGWHRRSIQGDFFSALAAMRLDDTRFGRIELWSHLARWDTDGAAYWYVYLRNRRMIVSGLFAAVKFAYTYARDSGDNHRPVLTVEVEAAW